MSHALQTTCLISLLQPPPETFQLFDDVMMISDGLILYHGKLWQGGRGGAGLQAMPVLTLWFTSGSDGLTFFLYRDILPTSHPSDLH